MKRIFILVCSCTLLAACGNSSKTNKGTDTDSTTIEVVDMHNAEIRLITKEHTKVFSLRPTVRALKQP